MGIKMEKEIKSIGYTIIILLAVIVGLLISKGNQSYNSSEYENHSVIKEEVIESKSIDKEIIEDAVWDGVRIGSIFLVAGGVVFAVRYIKHNNVF